jgi:hypothetical protein
MNPHYASGSDPNAEVARDVESTLRLIATLPAPRGIEDRVIARLSSTPRAGSVLSFPRPLSPAGNWLRAAAAAAIAFLVVGGGWGVYSRVQPSGVAVTVPQTSHSRGFSNAGAVRVPQTLQAPVLTDPALIQPADAEAAKEHGKAELRTKNKANAGKGNKPAKTPAEQPLSPAR